MTLLTGAYISESHNSYYGTKLLKLKRKLSTGTVLDEAQDLGATLIFTTQVIIVSTPVDRAKIRAAYDAGVQLIAKTVPQGAAPRPGIEACILRHKELKAANDVACAGWILAAIEARVGEKDLVNWRQLKQIIAASVELLGRYRGPRLH